MTNRIVEKIEVRTPSIHFLYGKVQHLSDSLKNAKTMTRMDAVHSAATIEALCTEVDTLREELAWVREELRKADNRG